MTHMASSVIMGSSVDAENNDIKGMIVLRKA